MSDILIAQEVGTVVVIETAPAEIVEVVAAGPQGPAGDVNPQMPVILAATEAARDTTLATIGTAALKANNLSDLASIPTALINLGLNNVSNTSDANKPISTATQTALNAKENTANKGVANGYAGLDATGKVPSAQLPSYVDDVLEFTNLAGFPATGEAGKIYVARDTNKTYRWSGSAYIYITSGAVDSVAGKTGVVVLAKADVGLGSVDNTSDADKPVSTAAQAALNLKANAASPTTTGTLTHSGDIVLSGSGKRIIGDFSNATVANRLMFQTSTVNGQTVIEAIPNGTNSVSMINLSTSSADTPNASLAQIRAGLDVNEVRFAAERRGTGTYLPMTFYTGGAERMRIDTGGNVGIGNTAPGYRLDVTAGDTTADLGYAMRLRSNATAQAATLQFTNNGVSVQNGYITVTDAGLMNLDGSSVIGFRTNSTERMRIDPAGDVSINQSKIGGGTRLQVSNPDPTPGSSAAVYVSQGNVLSRILTTQQASYLQTTSAHPLYFSTAEVTHAMLGAAGGFLVISPTGLGYGAGSGGTVTQATSKTTAVTLNKPTGRITMNNAALAANTRVVFQVNNSLVTADDNVVATYADDFGAVYRVDVQCVWAGYFQLGLTNVTAGALSQAVRINFAIIKGSVS